MKNQLEVTASFDEPPLLEKMAEKLAGRRYDQGYSRAKVPVSLKSVDTASAEIYTSGTIHLKLDDGEHLDMPFVTSFFFTCIKEKSSLYLLEWSVSLS